MRTSEEEKMAEKRPIDILRESGGTIAVGGDGDDSAVTNMIPIGDHMYIVKARGIYAVQMADQIDPRRTKIEIPNTEQRVIVFGSDHEIVARTLLTAHTMFRKTFLGPAFDRESGMELMLGILKDLLAMAEMWVGLEAAEAQALAARESDRTPGRTLRLPAIGNIEDRLDAFGQKAGHVIGALGAIAQLFYAGDLTHKWIDSLAALAARRYGDDDAFAVFMARVRPLLLFALDMRNMIEHPKPGKCIEAQDFRLHASGQLVPPSVRIVRPDQEPAQATVAALMAEITAELVAATELLVAYLCAVHARPPAGFPIQVLELPEAQRQIKHLRFCYGSLDGERVIPVGGG
jgi:hypothetical protein